MAAQKMGSHKREKSQTCQRNSWLNRLPFFVGKPGKEWMREGIGYNETLNILC